MELMQWVERRYLHPVVVVESCAAVDSSCQRSGLDLVQILRPFSVRRGSQYALVGERGESMLVKNFGVRLTRPECVCGVSDDHLLRECQIALRDAANSHLTDETHFDQLLAGLTDPQYGGPCSQPTFLDSTSAASTLLERASPRWHATFVERFHHMVRCSHVDTLDYPIGAIYAASTSEEGGVDGIRRIFRSQAARVHFICNNFPSMEGEFHEYFILIHDLANDRDSIGRKPSLADARKTLFSLQQIYGTNHCALITINGVSNLQEVEWKEVAPWAEASPSFLDVPSDQTPLGERDAGIRAPDASHGKMVASKAMAQNIGDWENVNSRTANCCLSPEDIATVREGMVYYLGQSLLKYVERRLRALDVSVQERRTTTFGKVAAWFKSNDDAKPRMELFMPQDGGTPRYLASSLEIQMRRAGDLSLALRDFGGAVNYFKMCMAELLETYPQRPYNHALIAACQEGIGIARFFQGKLELPSSAPWYAGDTRTKRKGSHRQCRLELALNDFMVSDAKVHALRVALFMYEFCRTRTTPALDRARGLLYHVLQSGVTADIKILDAVIHDMLGSTYLFMNPPYPAGMSAPGKMPSQYPVKTHLRTYVRHLVVSAKYLANAGVPKLALRYCQRALVVLRKMGHRGGWLELFEYVIVSISQLHFTIGLYMKGVVVVSAAIVAGTPMFSNRETGLPRFMEFWEKQRKALDEMGYLLCPHMTMPCISRDSFYVKHNYYGEDAATILQEKLIGKELAENEWRDMENITKNYYTNTTLGHLPQCRFPRFHGRMKPSYIFPSGPPPSPAGAASASRWHHLHQRQYSIPLGEPLCLCFSMYNPVGGVLVASNLCILYISKEEPEQLWKSSSTKTVVLQPGATEKVSLDFSAIELGEYFLIGLHWELLEQEGYYYFATKESRPGCSESLYEYAIEHSLPSPEAPENIAVVVTAPCAWLRAALDPPLPPRFQDGEYFHTRLFITNGSAHSDALWVTVQRSPRSAHLIWLEDFGLAQNLEGETPLMLADRLDAGKCLSFNIVFRAQHSCGDAALRCTNHIFLLLAYVSDEALTPPVPSSMSSESQCSYIAEGESAVTPVHSSPNLNSSTKNGSYHPHGNVPCTNTVRLHRLLRCVEVRPIMALYSTAFAPSNASLLIAVALTVKNITSGSTASSACVAQVMALHRAHWVVREACINQDSTITCMVSPGSALTMTLFVQRQKRSCLSQAAEQRSQEPCFISTECFPSATGLSSPTTEAALKQSIGSGLADASMNYYFLRTGFRGAGSIGAARESNATELTFYLDKAGQVRESEQRGRRATGRQAEESSYRRSLEQYTPMAIAVAWSAEGGPGKPPRRGQLFHLFDPMAFPPPRVGLRPRAAAPAAEEVADPSGAASLARQEKLCEALVGNRSVSVSGRDVVAYHVRAPPRVSTTESRPTAAIASLVFRCLSLARASLLVEVVAAMPGHDLATTAPTPTGGVLWQPPLQSEHSTVTRMQLFFVGKTKHVFLLHPGNVHEVPFTARILGPGIVDCNCFCVRATPLVLSLDEISRLPTGTSRRVLIETMRRVVEKDALSGRSAAITDNFSFTKGEIDEKGGNRPSQLPPALSSMQYHPAEGAHRMGTEAGSSAMFTAYRSEEELLRHLLPRDFSCDQLRVIGCDIPAYTEARFPHFQPPYIMASEAAFAEKIVIYQNDLTRYQQRLKAFNDNVATNTDGRVPYVYRPQVCPAQSIALHLQGDDAHQILSKSCTPTAHPTAQAVVVGMGAETCADDSTAHSLSTCTRWPFVEPRAAVSQEFFDKPTPPLPLASRSMTTCDDRSSTASTMRGLEINFVEAPLQSRCLSPILSRPSHIVADFCGHQGSDPPFDDIETSSPLNFLRQISPGSTEVVNWAAEVSSDTVLLAPQHDADERSRNVSVSK